MFDAAPAQSDHALLQDPVFAAALRHCGERPVTLDSGHVVLVRRLLGVKLAMLPRAAPPADLPHLLRAARLHRLPLILSPETPLSAHPGVPLARAKRLWMLDLRPEEAERRAALHQNWRHALRRAEAGPLRVLHRPLAPDHPVIALAAQQARARGYALWPAPLTAAFSALSPAQSHLFTALRQGHPVAHMVFLQHGCRASYHIGHRMEAAEGAHQLLLWQAARQLRRLGVTRIDLGPDIAQAPGLARFKRRAGARAQVTGGTWLRWRPLS
ncbi:GNAT family N-acetyltransferase [Sulfitobacter sp. S190]|uniref:GNAT family N-acetyltransferase n=1 Tax=Sulfitobacter sp. S190 TaxID=2867022 RepID=UPI0021A48FFB|nr:GNAT family N-acetyltransferase [Sulfitobacter sp. S190]UWR23815.1 GNAT family N-acetyltransferase [Sulfitobacter sp. S190]